MKSCHTRIYGAEFSRQDIKQAAGSGGLLSMEIEFNRECNFNCIYCYVQDDARGREELSREEAGDVIEQARALGAKKIIILGGEPMLYPHIMEMIGFIKDRGMQVELFTNGTNITPATARQLAEYGVVIALKMNTKDEKLQDVLSGRKGAYRNIQDAFRNLKEAGYPQTAPLGISTVICNHNINDLIDMWKWMREEKITPYIEMITPQGKASENGLLDIDPGRIRELFYEIAEIDRKEYGYSWDPQPPLVGGQCLRHQFSCAVNAYGDVMPCIGVTLPLGNIREDKLSDILRDSEVIQALRNYKETIKGPCGQCARRSDCYGCRGAAYQMTGDYLASDPTCWKNAGRQEEIISLPLDISGLVPHERPMLLVDRLLEVRERKSVSEIRISEDSIFVTEDGRLDEVSYPEIFSQAIAAQSGFKNLGKNGSAKPEGLLLGVKNLEVLDRVVVGDTVHVSVFKAAKYGGFGIIKGEIFKGDSLVARGEIKVWQNDKGNGGK